MSNEVGFVLPAPSTKFAPVVRGESALSSGIAAGFGEIKYKGGKWSTRFRGVTTVLMRSDGTGALGEIPLVILKAANALSKTYYDGAFVEGSDKAPDCTSTNGITPHPSSPKKQAAACLLCPMNQYGTGRDAAGVPTKGKACKDNKRLAVVPLHDIQNDVLGGPMLLRVPPSSLKAVAGYGDYLAKMGHHEYGVGTGIGFNPLVAYPEFTFKPICVLTDTQADQVLDQLQNLQVDRILNEDPELGAVAPEQLAPPAAVVTNVVPITPKVTPAPAPAPAAVAPAPAPVAAKPKAPKPAPKPVAAPAPAPVSNGFGGASIPVAAAPPAVSSPDTAPSESDGSDLDKSMDDKLALLMGS